MVRFIGGRSLHRAREFLVRQRRILINTLRAYLAAFGIVAARGALRVRELRNSVEEDRLDIPEIARSALLSLVRRVDGLEDEIAKLDRNILTWHRTSAVSQRLATIPGVGVLTATALAATVADPSQFRSARQFAAWPGSATELFGRKRQAGADHEDGRWLPAQTARCRSNSGAQADQGYTDPNSRLGPAFACK